MQEKSWEQINDLGREYYEIKCETGSGISIEDRSARQQQLVSEIVSRTVSFMYKIAVDIRNGNGFHMSLNGRTNVLKYYNPRLTLDDLANIGLMAVFSEFHDYDPGKGSVSNYIAQRAASKMVKASTQVSGFIHIPFHDYHKAIKIFRNSASDAEAVEKLRDVYGYSGIVLYSIMRNKARRLHFEDNGNGEQRPYEADIPNDSLLEILERENLIEKIRDAVESLPLEMDRITLKLFFKFDGKDCSLEEICKILNEKGFIPRAKSRERARQIKEKALRKLKPILESMDIDETI